MNPLFFNNRKHIYALTAMVDIKKNNALNNREQGVILALPHVQTRLDAGPSLADQNIPRENMFACIALNAQALAITVTIILAGTATFFMSHDYLSYP
jgi:hypothetical protein